MILSDYQKLMLPAVDSQIRRTLNSPVLDPYNDLREILFYHLGYEGDKGIPGAQGKRIRPLLTMLSAEAAGGSWQNSIPAAAAVELLHNFSLIHDDIEDRSETRRGRPTVWAKWGVPLAINAGDAMYALAFSALEPLSENCSVQVALSSFMVMTRTCIRLTGGQHLDISYEDADNLPLESYWSMISGKTAALLSACVQLGAITANVPAMVIQKFETFGCSLGLSFQIQDDCLGIWGTTSETGKSIANDLATRKKTLPILFGIRKGGDFAARWQTSANGESNFEMLASLLAKDGAKTFAEGEANRLTIEAMTTLDEIGLHNDAGEALRELTTTLLNRRN